MNILFFGIDYHNYTRSLIAEMEVLGANVTFVDLQPRTIFYKVVRTVAPALYARIVRSRLVNALEWARSFAFDKVIFLQAHQMPTELLRNLRCSQTKAEFVLYNWDAVTTHNYLPQSTFFDKVYTFDPSDADEYGFKYLPLFCQRDLQQLGREHALKRRIYTVGNIVNPLRYDAIKALQVYCERHNIVFEVHMKITPVIYLKFLRMGRIPWGVSLRSIKPKKFHAMIQRADAVFDFANHQAQSGHTMRTFENLCGGKKIVTNNRLIKREDFYSDDRIFVYDSFEFYGLTDFLDKPLETPEATFEEYYIQSFTKTLLGLTTGVEAL